ncbi:MAG: hypothetical protein R6X13_07725 [bacterium]
MLLRIALALALLCALAPCADLDGDGIADTPLVLTDPENDGCFGIARPAGGASLSDSIEFRRAWDSGTWLNNQWGADAGFLDGDTLLDILGMHFSPNQLHVFESDGVGGFDHVWAQTESMPPGSYGALCHGDPDRDGAVEILGGDVSTLGKVVLLENVADDSWALPRVLFQARLRLRAIRIADTNGNDTAEIILFCGSTDGGKVQVWEHDGAPGVHSYRLLYEYTTVSYLFNGEVGDADNDGYPEMLLGIGGMHGFPMYMRRLVYDPQSRTYSHHMYEHPEVVGLHIAPHVADFDTNGQKELAVGSSGADNGQVHVFECVGGDTFQRLWTSSMTTTGNVITVTAGRFEGRGRPLLFAAPFGGAVYGFARDDTAFHGVSCFTTPGPVRSMTHVRDRVTGAGCDQLVLAENGSEQAAVWRAYDLQAVDEAAGPAVRQLRIGPSPARTAVRVGGSGPVLVCDACGRVVRRLGADAASWDLRDDAGRRVRAGVYAVRRGPASARLVVAD